VHHVLVVVVDTSTPAVTAALARVDETGTEVLAQRVTVDARAHGELLAPQLQAVLASAGVSVRELGAIVAGVGPGPFTGLRVGLVTAAVIGQTRAIPTYGVCSLDAIGARTAQTRGRVLVATDARRKEIYWAVYEDGKPVTPPAVGRPQDVAEELVDEHKAVAAAGEGAERYAEQLGLPVLAGLDFPQPAALAALAADRILARAPGETLRPLYLRRPDAVEPGAPKQVRS
jgi:tRNA threonylcarbamoyl adenosine modification protein YeaZ